MSRTVRAQLTSTPATVFMYPEKHKVLSEFKYPDSPPAPPAPPSDPDPQQIEDLDDDLYPDEEAQVAWYYVWRVCNNNHEVQSIHIHGLAKACETYSLLLRDPKYTKFRKPGRYLLTRRRGVPEPLDAAEINAFEEVEKSCKGAAKADFDANRRRLEYGM